ncbi:hypothetical protein OHB04_02490 [Streptomyces sp. NBC_01775]|uniref:hypothetical protein n=1 Tax=Streptomyces sp. NBC_01775 TaxID=2975939 RepID=UPI002DDA520F|nr:hypothetical protein [Streptomyces sp. NBC_01775]WSB74762.1 hypothetical protein OHB04_02490 [Streptomyces sp. NBC_01775]
MPSRPALVLAEVLAVVLVLLAPQALTVALTAVVWSVQQPLMVGAALAATVVWCLMVPDRRRVGGWA